VGEYSSPPALVRMTRAGQVAFGTRLPVSLRRLAIAALAPAWWTRFRCGPPIRQNRKIIHDLPHGSLRRIIACPRLQTHLL
jgi:hypothetical protein